MRRDGTVHDGSALPRHDRGSGGRVPMRTHARRIRSAGLAILLGVCLLVVGVGQGQAREFEIDGIADCGLRSDRRCSIDDVLALWTDDLSGELERIEVDVSQARVTPRPTLAQRRLLERLAARSTVRLPPWTKRIQLVAVGEQTEYLSTPTFRALLRHGWIVRASGPGDQVPSYRLSEAGRQALDT